MSDILHWLPDWQRNRIFYRTALVGAYPYCPYYSNSVNDNEDSYSVPFYASRLRSASDPVARLKIPVLSELEKSKGGPCFISRAYHSKGAVMLSCSAGKVTMITLSSSSKERTMVQYNVITLGITRSIQFAFRIRCSKRPQTF